jgi:hypothetical protein
MESPSSETGDNMPTGAADATPTTNGIEVDGTMQSQVHGDSPR